MDISITTSKCYNKKEGKINVKKGTTMTKTVQKSKARDMTQGSIWKQLLLFSLPLMAGNLFQQLYNTVDSIVVGNFVGKEALAAVGSVGPIINSLIGFFMGLSTGAGVIISQYYGAKADEKVSRTVSTTLVMTFFLSIVFTILGIFITPYMLRMMSTPNDVIRESATYLKIYFGGVAGLMFYNMGSGVLRAVGDSRHPLYFLIFSAVVNTVLDLLFVVFWHGNRGCGACNRYCTVPFGGSDAVCADHNRRPIPHLLEKALHGLVFAVPHRLRRTAGSDPADGDFRFQRFRAVLYQCIRLGCYGRLECLHENRPVYDAADDECWSCFDHLHRTERRCQLH